LRRRDALRTFGRKDREDRADRDVDVDVARAVKRVEAGEIRSEGKLLRNGDGFGNLLAHHAADGAGAGDGFNEDVVRNDVELLLLFTLHVFAAGKTEHAREGAFADLGGNFFAGLGDADEKTGENRVGAGERFLAREEFLK